MSNYFSKLARRTGLECPAAVSAAKPPQKRHARPEKLSPGSPSGLEIHVKTSVRPETASHPVSEPLRPGTAGSPLEHHPISSHPGDGSKSVQTPGPSGPSPDGGRHAIGTRAVFSPNEVDAGDKHRRPPAPPDTIADSAVALDSSPSRTKADVNGTRVNYRSGRSEHGNESPGKGGVPSDDGTGDPAETIQRAGRSVRFRPSAMHRQEDTPRQTSGPSESDTIDQMVAPDTGASVYRHPAGAGPKSRVHMVLSEGSSQPLEALSRPAVTNGMPPPGSTMGEQPGISTTRQTEDAVDIRIGTISFEVHATETTPSPPATPW